MKAYMGMEEWLQSFLTPRWLIPSLHPCFPLGEIAPQPTSMSSQGVLPHPGIEVDLWNSGMKQVRLYVCYFQSGYILAIRTSDTWAVYRNTFVSLLVGWWWNQCSSGYCYISHTFMLHCAARILYIDWHDVVVGQIWMLMLLCTRCILVTRSLGVFCITRE
jgi:hypothetical protein